ncbi:MAG: Wzz/FepE/Etk N-terminal domain-containing protein [Porticoccaceae bacterium]|nr:Wzz/FepE/Etk N-terminal domain-containing protein [Porticoccaceae bacterium]
MQNEREVLASHDDEIDLRELFSVLWAGKKVIVAITGLFAAAAVVYALSIANEYKASIVIAPAQQEGGGLSGALGQLGGLASLAGVSLGGGGGSEAAVAQEIMQSWGFVEQFIVNNELEVEVFAAEGWNKTSNVLTIDSDLYDKDSNKWLIDEDGQLRAPTSWELYEAFSKRLSVSEDKKSGLTSVSIEYFSPIVAKNWVDLYVAAINEHMRQRKLSQVNSNIEYLQAQIEKTSIAEMREVFYQIIEEQVKNKMLAEASPEYAFVTVSPSMVPEEKSKPKRALMCILGTLLGGMLSVLYVLVRHYASNKKDD